MTATQNDVIAELQRAKAELRRERDAVLLEMATLAEELTARTAELADRKTEFDERIEHQSATIDVLKAMSASPGDAQPVFDLIARQAANQCNVPTAAVATFDGTMMYLTSESGLGAAYVSQFPRPVGLDFSMGRAVLNRRVDQVEDFTAYPGHSFVDVLGNWSVMAVPMLRHDVPLGAITIGRPAIGPFSASQIALLQTFAEQAVIAISSAETYRALQGRTADLQESLEYQTATSDVLKVISRSTFDLHPVLTMVAEIATRLCAADQALFIRHDNGTIQTMANFGYPPEYAAFLDELGPHPLIVDAPMVGYRAIVERRVVHVNDVAPVSGYAAEAIELGQQRTSLGVPLLRAGEPIGSIVLTRRRVEPFTDRQIGLVSTFADQAVIAIENTRLLTEQREALEQQTATAEVLQVINSSPGNLEPVFDAILEKAMRLCGGTIGGIFTFDGDHSITSALRGVTAAFKDYNDEYPMDKIQPGTLPARIIETRGPAQNSDLTTGENYRAGHPYARALVELGGIRAVLAVPLLEDGDAVGMVVIYREEAGAFSEKQIALLENFAAQAVIAMENARLLNEQREALEQQTATAEVLQVINSSPGILAPVFDVMLDKALGLCDAAFGVLWTHDGERGHAVAFRGTPPAFAEYLRRSPHPIGRGGVHARLLAGEPTVHIEDIAEDQAYWSEGNPVRRALVELGGGRTLLAVPLRKDNAYLGHFVIYRREVRAFSNKQIALLQNFAAQAVVAMENARLLNEVRQRQEELRVTFENMGDGVAMFDETQRLVAWNGKFQEVFDLPDGLLQQHRTYEEYLRFLAERGDFGAAVDTAEQIAELVATTGQPYGYERTRPDGRVIEIRRNPVPDGGFVLIFSDITERKRSEAEIHAARDAAEAAYRDLKAAQASLIQAEKMASLGQLTAGIAHEIKNPLNFVNNFAALSVDLLSELKETAAPGFAVLSEKQRAEVDDVSALLTSNLEKITEHGKRADGIVKAMLEHSRGSSGERRMVDLNALIDEALNLAYHGARAQDQSFNITLERDFAEGLAPIELAPQDMTRVFLNLFSNGFYAATRRARNDADAGFTPTLKVTTRDAGEAVEIRVRDNGIGISAEISDKLFQPFFTTKPTGEGTGLGLSISYDIIVNQHRGQVTVDSRANAFTDFVVTLPRELGGG
jgi:two-component system, NtrC family, sensor kinase